MYGVRDQNTCPLYRGFLTLERSFQRGSTVSQSDLLLCKSISFMQCTIVDVWAQYASAAHVLRLVGVWQGKCDTHTVWGVPI